MSDHSENLSGTKGRWPGTFRDPMIINQILLSDAYYPYSTTKPKVDAWDPKKS
jgi:hypothetical protein